MRDQMIRHVRQEHAGEAASGRGKGEVPMKIKQRLTNVIENTIGITLTTAQVRELCRDALARIQQLEGTEQPASGEPTHKPTCARYNGRHGWKNGIACTCGAADAQRQGDCQ